MTSLGAGGSLIAAALCAAALVGGLLAVRGVVDGAAEAQRRRRDHAGRHRVRGAGLPAPVDERRGAHGRGGERRHGARERRRRARTRPVERRRTTPPAASPPASEAPSGGSDTGSTGDDAGGGSGPATPAPPPATGERSGTVQRVVQQTRRDHRARASRQCREPVQPTVDQVADAVEERRRHGRRDARAGHRPAAVGADSAPAGRQRARAGAGSRAARGCGRGTRRRRRRRGCGGRRRA